MKLLMAPILAIGVSLASYAAETKTELTEQKDKVSYALGMNMGMNLKRQNVEVNSDVLMQGLKDALSGNKQLLTDDQMRETFKQLNQEVMARQQKVREEQLTKNKAAGEAFLAENAKKEGIVKLPSGLQYKVITEGSGPSPKATDRVSVKYRGTLIDGTEFDSTEKNGGAPATFRVDGVIKGWTEALQKMKKGAKWQLFIPGDLAYGERGSPPKIEPNATLVFDVELLDILPPQETAAPQPVTSDIIKVPSADELKKGAKIEVLKEEDVKREIEKQKALQQQKATEQPKK
jgi:FKBP-type peptidyl-prolyl cis-trans isomerase FklB